MTRRTLARHLRRWLGRFRRRPALVLWGRPIDRLAGSPEDLALARLEHDHALRVAATMASLARVSARQTSLMGAVGVVGAVNAVDAINELGRALDRHLEAQGPALIAARDAALARIAKRRGDAAELAQIIGAAPIGRPHRFADLTLDAFPGTRTR